MWPGSRCVGRSGELRRFLGVQFELCRESDSGYADGVNTQASQGVDRCQQYLEWLSVHG